MDIKKCEKCSNDLAFSATEITIKCSSCGTEYEMKNAKYKRKAVSSDSHDNVTSEIVEGVIESFLDSIFD